MCEQQQPNSDYESFKLLLVERSEDLEFVGPEVEELQCVVCQDVAILLTVIDCGHVMCKECHAKLTKKTGKKCPKCKTIITDKSDKSSELQKLKIKIDRLVIKCLNHKTGCKYEDEIGEMEEHMKSCPKLIEQKKESDDESVVDLRPEAEQNEKKNTDTDSKRNTDIPKELNILLLGQTGAGKSTFINAFANYLKYKDFENAISSVLEVKIPCRFNIYDENSEQRTIVFGSDTNEKLQTGESCTQNCKTHEFRHEGHVIRIFDTPGVGDTRGSDQDKMNLEETLDVLSRYQHLHSICILLKPNESRLTATFEYSIKQLLCQLQRNAVNNIVFVFTHARGTNYKPGDTLGSLNEVLQRIKSAPPHVDVPLSKDNVFCLDNEAFKFLLAIKNDVKFSSDDRKEYEKSWKISGEKCRSLIDYVIKNCSETPCSIRETLCINHVRKAIIDLSKPLALTAQNIHDNLQVLKQQIRDIDDCMIDEQKLKDLLYIPIVRLKFNELDAPRTVCQSDKCAEKYMVCHVTRHHYPQICCEPCGCKKAHENSRNGDDNIRFCKAFHQKTGICLKCECPYAQHMQIYYESFIEEEKIVDEDVVNGLEKDVKKAAVKIIDNLKTKETILKTEKTMLTKHTATLSIFLQMNAILSYNDAFEAYLDQQIANQRTSLDDDKTEAMRELEEMKMNYKKEKEFVEKPVSGESDVKEVSIDDVIEVVKQLYEMKVSGEILAVATKAKMHEKMQMENARAGWFSLAATITTVTTGVVGVGGVVAALTIAPALLVPAAVAATASAGTGVIASAVYLFNKMFGK